jgi:hypothetical protein
MKLYTKYNGHKELDRPVNFDIKKVVLSGESKKLELYICRFRFTGYYGWVYVRDFNWNSGKYFYIRGNPMFYPSKKVIVFIIREIEFDNIEFHFTEHGWKRILTYMKRFRKTIYRK